MSKRIFITGGASGLGRALAEHYVRQGWKVLIGDLNEERGAGAALELAAEGDIHFLPLDVTREESLEKAREWIEEQWGGLDVLVNNAGVAAAGRIEKIPQDDWDWMLDINLKGVARGCRVFTPLFKREGGGHIVNIASMAGLLNPPMMSSYNVAKAGVVALSETLRFELEPWGIHTTVVCPGFFQTNLAESLRTPEPGMEKTVGKLLASSEIDANDIARMIAAAVEKRQFMLLPHKEGRKAWFFKRFLPRLYNGQIRQMAQRYKSKLSE